MRLIINLHFPILLLLMTYSKSMIVRSIAAGTVFDVKEDADDDCESSLTNPLKGVWADPTLIVYLPSQYIFMITICITRLWSSASFSLPIKAGSWVEAEKEGRQLVPAEDSSSLIVLDSDI